MSLIRANGTRTASGPNRMFSGVTTVAGAHRRENIAFNAGSRLNFPVGEAAVAGQTDHAAVPNGALPSVSWILPRKTGGIVARTGRIVGAGETASPNLAGGRNAAAELAGAGDVVGAALALVLSAVAALSGSGALDGAIAGRLDAAASLAGAGDAAAALGAVASLLSEISGSGEVAGSSTLKAKGSLSAEIVVTGTALSTANIADAILDAINSIEQGVSLRQATRLILAAVAGKATIDGATITFRNAVADDTDRIVATTTSDGERTAITYDTE